MGAHAEILHEFEHSFEHIKNTHRNEQEYLSAAMMAKDALVYWPDSWCRSFKRHCIKPFSFLIARETEMPQGTRVLVSMVSPTPMRRSRDEAVNGPVAINQRPGYQRTGNNPVSIGTLKRYHQKSTE